MYSPKTSLNELIIVSALLFSSCAIPRVLGDYSFANYFYSDNLRALLENNFGKVYDFLKDLDFKVKNGEFK